MQVIAEALKLRSKKDVAAKLKTAGLRSTDKVGCPGSSPTSFHAERVTEPSSAVRSCDGLVTLALVSGL